MSSDSDLEYMSDLRAAVSRRPTVVANMLLLGVAAFFLIAFIWAAWAEIDQVSSGEGRVIPSSQVQVVQNLEGGILSELRVSEGDVVEQGEILMQLDDTQFSSEFKENELKFLGLQAVTARLQAEINETKLAFPGEIEKQLPDVAKSERELFQSRAKERVSTLAKYASQLRQREHEVEETRARIEQLKRAIDLARDEIAILAPLVEKGINAPVELIRLRREESQYVGDLEVAKQSVARILESIEETKDEIDEVQAQFRNRALEELNEAQVNMEALRQNLTSRSDRLSRTVVRAPVKGTVKQLFITTIGGVVRPGMDLLEIVPAEENLFVEAKIKPADIAFLHPGLKATVKFSAYDPTIYGSLPATLDHISADTIVEEETGERFYMVRVKTRAEGLKDADDKPLPIIPGMTATVDVITGKRTVLQYILKPFNRVAGRALREK